MLQLLWRADEEILKRISKSFGWRLQKARLQLFLICSRLITMKIPILTGQREYLRPLQMQTFFGVPKMFVPRWSWAWSSPAYPSVLSLNGTNDPMDGIDKPTGRFNVDWINPINWTYLYDHTPLANTLDKYIDYNKLNLTARRRNLAFRSSINYYSCRCVDR